MATITLDLEQLKKEREEHQKAIKRIDCVIEYFFGKGNMGNDDVALAQDSTTTNTGITRMKQALDICEEYLKQGNIVTSVNQFRKIVNEKGVEISRPGIALAFKKPESKIYYDNNSRTWKLK